MNFTIFAPKEKKVARSENPDGAKHRTAQKSNAKKSMGKSCGTCPRSRRFSRGLIIAVELHSADSGSADGVLVNLSSSAAYIISQRQILSDMAIVQFRY
jgi:hypothetical protein